MVYKLDFVCSVFSFVLLFLYLIFFKSTNGDRIGFISEECKNGGEVYIYNPIDSCMDKKTFTEVVDYCEDGNQQSWWSDNYKKLVTSLIASKRMGGSLISLDWVENLEKHWIHACEGESNEKARQDVLKIQQSKNEVAEESKELDLSAATKVKEPASQLIADESNGEYQSESIKIQKEEIFNEKVDSTTDELPANYFENERGKHLTVEEQLETNEEYISRNHMLSLNVGLLSSCAVEIAKQLPEWADGVSELLFQSSEIVQDSSISAMHIDFLLFLQILRLICTKEGVDNFTTKLNIAIKNKQFEGIIKPQLIYFWVRVHCIIEDDKPEASKVLSIIDHTMNDVILRTNFLSQLKKFSPSTLLVTIVGLVYEKFFLCYFLNYPWCRKLYYRSEQWHNSFQAWFILGLVSFLTVQYWVSTAFSWMKFELSYEKWINSAKPVVQLAPGLIINLISVFFLVRNFLN